MSIKYLTCPYLQNHIVLAAILDTNLLFKTDWCCCSGRTNISINKPKRTELPAPGTQK